jgi:hypothetical protein
MTPNASHDVESKSQELLQGPLSHIRGAALAAALLPLASVAVSQAQAQTCSSAGTCNFIVGTVFDDANNNGVQDAGESGISGAVVTLDTFNVTFTDENGNFWFDVSQSGTYEIAVQIPPGTEPSPTDVGDDASDSDGAADEFGNSVVTVDVTVPGSIVDVDFGFSTSQVVNPGTGTPGYWKNHPEAWPVDVINVGGVDYTKQQAIDWLNNVGKDKTTTMFSSLVPAMLNVLIGNDPSCVQSTIAAANDWMSMYGPVGSGVHAASYAWKVGEPLHRQMDNYNNGMLCAPHRE